MRELFESLKTNLRIILEPLTEEEEKILIQWMLKNKCYENYIFIKDLLDDKDN